jgi:hypothetical protein
MISFMLLRISESKATGTFGRFQEDVTGGLRFHGEEHRNEYSHWMLYGPKKMTR